MVVACALAVASCGDAGGIHGPSDPGLAQFVTSDLEHFWDAYDAGGRYGAATAFQSRYLDLASPGLRDFMASRNITATSVATMARAFPLYLDAIRPNTMALVAGGPIVDRIRANYATTKSLYPPAEFPPVTFLFGHFNTGGTTGRSGILIALEGFSADATTPLGEFGPNASASIHHADEVPILVAHEHVHVLQASADGFFYARGKTLLQQALIEGGADFVGELSSGGNINGRLSSFALPREHDLWIAFQADMHGSDASRWLYNGATATADWPGDLGYFVGYRIAQALYDKADDKAAAVAELITLRDATALLARSGYAP